MTKNTSQVSIDQQILPLIEEGILSELPGSAPTGKPKGGVHCTGGYILWVSMTHEKHLCVLIPPSRILRKVAEGNVTNLGDASIVADPAVVAELLEARGLPPLSQSH